MKSWRSVFAVVPACHASVGHYTRLWKQHFYDGIKDVVPCFGMPQGLDFTWAFSPDNSQKSRERTLAAEKLRDQLLAFRKQNDLDVVLSYARSVEIDPDLVREITVQGIPWINFFCDSVGDFESVKSLAEACSLNWFPENSAIPRYSALGRRHVCRPYAYNPQALPPLPAAKKRHAVGFVGMPTQNRVALLGALAGHGHPPTIRGHGWITPAPVDGPPQPRWKKLLSIRKILAALKRHHSLSRLKPWIGGPLDEMEFLNFLAECEIVLGLNEAQNPAGRTESYLKFRDLEMPGLGCCYLTQDNQDIRHSLDSDKEVLLFTDIREAADKIDFYTRRPELAAQIATAARAKVLRDHVWSARILELHQALNF